MHTSRRNEKYRIDYCNIYARIAVEYLNKAFEIVKQTSHVELQPSDTYLRRRRRRDGTIRNIVDFSRTDRRRYCQQKLAFFKETFNIKRRERVRRSVTKTYAHRYFEKCQSLRARSLNVLYGGIRLCGNDFENPWSARL